MGTTLTKSWGHLFHILKQFILPPPVVPQSAFSFTHSHNQGMKLPFGVIMATGGASQMARAGILHFLSVPLLALGIVLAIVIPAVRWWRHHRKIFNPQNHYTNSERNFLFHHFGEFTIPLGLAVIGSGLAKTGNEKAILLAEIIAILAWISTIVITIRTATSTKIKHRELWIVDGSWFLAPAAYLGDAIVTADLANHLPGIFNPALGWLSVTGTILGVLGYLLTLAIASIRVRYYSLKGVPLVLWWISAGCGGLAAAAAGQLNPVFTDILHMDSTVFLPGLTVALWIIGSILLIPVLAGSLSYLFQRRHFTGSPAWPPTFSMAVYAMGCFGVGQLADWRFVNVLGTGAAFTTVILWLGTTTIYLIYQFQKQL